MQVLVRIAPEVNLKTPRIKARFVRRLQRNIKSALAAHGVTGEFRERWSRIFIELSSPEGLVPLARVFGVGSISVVEKRVEPTLAAMVEAAVPLYKDAVAGKTFCVRAKRAKQLKDFTSKDIELALGGALYPYANGVNLKHPEVKVEVEVRSDGAYFYTSRIKGPGGMPLGVEGRALCLISGGFDSAVAAWHLMKRGIALDFAFCNLAGGAYERSVLTVAKGLVDGWAHGTHPMMHVLDFAPVVNAIKANTRPQYNQLILKRMMYRAASRLVTQKLEDTHAIITGEAVGQVSSQTLANLAAINDASEVMVLRPLVGFDKEEIIAKSREIGTFVLCEHIQEYCAINPSHPVTKARPEIARHEDAKVPAELIEQAVETRQVIDLRRLEQDDLLTRYLFIDHIPTNARIVDCRPESQYQAWHYPGAENRDLDTLLTQWGELPKDGIYVFYCSYGLQTAVLAEKMQGAGYQAYTFKGGTRALMALAGTQQ